MGQSFTAGLTGNLDKVGALIMQETGVTADMRFTLFSIINNEPLVSQGISLNIPNSKIPVGNGNPGNYSLNDMMTIDLSQYNFQVVAGMEYGMLVHSSIGPKQHPMINWFGGCGNNQSVQCGYNNGTTDTNLAGTPLAIGINGPLTNFIVGPYPVFDFAFATYVTPVPEPESYAMMLTCLSLMGFVARRRK